MQAKNYFPCLTVRASECQALKELAEPTKDLIFPIIRLQAWPREKAGCGGPVQRSIDHIKEAFGDRPIAVDLALPRADLETDWALVGREEISNLRSSENGFGAWCELVEAQPTFIPTVQWSNDAVALMTQVQRLALLGKGVVLRFRKSEGWNLAQFANLQTIDLSTVPLLLVFDYEQIGRNEDLTLAGTLVQNAMLAIKAQIAAPAVTFIFTASSFPSQFKEIHPEYANITLRERQLYEMLKQSIPIVQSGIELHYGDHASVFAADREPAFRGAPRADYPTRTSWIYHRCPQGFLVAAQRVLQDPLWNNDLLCWGAQKIRVAGGGNMTGLNAQGPWVTIRLNIHMHLQTHFNDEGTGPVEEQWVD